MANPEKTRLKEASGDPLSWKRWGPYLSERAWGTVREDYSADGNAWEYFPHDQARSRTYRWSEDGLAGISDHHQLLCFALALHNGKDPIIKERIFGLANPQGNHGEDPKEYWWYLDSTPTHSWMRWRYMYPQDEFPYEDLITTNRNRSKSEAEYELVDTGVFDDGRYWEVTVDYAKADVNDILAVITVRNMGSESATIDVLPTLWFRNTWSWGLDPAKPTLKLDADHIRAEQREIGTFYLSGEPCDGFLFCDNETNSQALWGVANSTAYPKDGINDHIVSGKETVNPSMIGTKASLRYKVTLASGESRQIKLRLSDAGPGLKADFDSIVKARLDEADAFYEELTPSNATDDETLVMRQAFAGMLWSKQFYHYDVARWLDGDPAGPEPPPERKTGRNAHWRHLDNFDIISMPDKWEYPWYAAWDLAFHCIPLAHIDPDFAKEQMLLMLREWYEHPNGQIPAYEWNFGDVNPPVHAWASLKIFEIDGSKDRTFLARVFQKLILNFTWWVNMKDRDGNNVFEGGFLGLDNIGPIDRSSVIEDGHLEQSDGTSWMAMYALDLMKMALILAQKDEVYEDIASKFFEHFCYIASGINSAGLSHGLWDEQEGFYYDLLHRDGGERMPLRVRSMVGLIVLYAVEVIEAKELLKLPNFVDRKGWFLSDKQEMLHDLGHIEGTGDEHTHLLSIVSPQRMRQILSKMLDETEFLSTYGIRALSKYHESHPFHVDLGDGVFADVHYEPGDSMTGMFGGNSNWRGPIWMPVNYMLIDSLRKYAMYLGEEFTVEHPTNSGQQMTLEAVADDLSRRLVSMFTRGQDGRRAALGTSDLLQNDPAWRDLVTFHEYFHGDTGAGIGATHQTGWTGLVADLIVTGHGCATPKRKRRVTKRPPTVKV